jgi:hypothetical protein
MCLVHGMNGMEQFHPTFAYVWFNNPWMRALQSKNIPTRFRLRSFSQWAERVRSFFTAFLTVSLSNLALYLSPMQQRRVMGGDGRARKASDSGPSSSAGGSHAHDGLGPSNSGGRAREGWYRARARADTRDLTDAGARNL